MLVVQGHVPAHDQVILRLGFLKFSVVIGLNLDQGAKDILVLVGVVVSKQDLGDDLLLTGALFEVGDCSIGVVLPQFLELCNSLGTQMTGAELLLVGWGRDKPGKEGTVFNEGLPARCVPVHVFLRGHCGAWLATEQHNDRVRLCGDETEQEDILGAAIIALECRIAERRGGMQLDFLVAGADQMVDDVR